MLLSLFLACTGPTTTTDSTDKTDSTDESTGTGETASPETGDTFVETGDTATVDPCAALTLEVGNGADEHLPLSPGDPVRVVSGAQGGWHIDVSGILTGTTSIVSVHPTVTRVSDGLQLAGEQPPAFLALVPSGECGGEFREVRAFIDDHQPVEPYEDFICTLGGEELEIEVEVVDIKATDVTITETIRVLATSDPADACP